LLNITDIATAGTMSARMRASGSDNSGANYANGVYEVRTNNTSAILAANLGQTSWNMNSSGVETSGNCPISYSFDINAPKLSARTRMMGFSTGLTTAADAFRFFYHAHTFNGTTSFDSISFIAPGNIAGRLNIYGYNN